MFRITLLHFERAGWDVSELESFDSLEKAESALIAAMGEMLDAGVTVTDKPMRMRFGKGRVGRPGKSI